ncbi:putative protein (DUF452 domain) [Campylobacter iguaniorum]|uniref:DUF452 domain protein n=1 Tax=Campylobacter iguaniorum TaxID=1244531 RepID=A0A076F837_9BACT|nr:pimeloyl-ACP methyl esterase BioG family protein [Campylobacter iguaniorum]AII14360.1 hypothetical protein (DUF452 domain) [Campylobacter iguaniorum]ALV24096.1 putative protein (DUF452 domain) [Campylobacter iguaniorum]
MKIEFVKNSGKKLILLFLGYSFLPSCIKHLELTGYDLCVVYDYSSLEFDRQILEGKEIYLVAWSMGVWAANLALAGVKLKQAIAINGTPFGIDDERGIPKIAFKKSIDEFNFDEFKKICFLKELAKVDFDFNQNAKFELESLYLNSSKPVQNNVKWDKFIISKKDFVFPPKAVQKVAGELGSKCEIINAPHFAFFGYKSFGEIVEI